MERMRKLTEETPEEMSPEELQKRFEKVETQSAECTYILMFTVSSNYSALFGGIQPVDNE